MINEKNKRQQSINRTRANGSGTICKRKGRKKPYEVSVTVRYDIDPVTQKVKRISKSLGYYANKKEAEQVLDEYVLTRNKNKINGVVCRLPENITFEQLYNRFVEDCLEFATQSTKTSYQSSFNALKSIHKRRFISLIGSDIKTAILESGKNHPMMKKMKLLCSKLYQYAELNNLVTRNLALTFKFDQKESIRLNPNARQKHVFEPFEIEQIMNDEVNRDFADTVIFLLYTGVRVNEMLDLRREDVHLDEGYIEIIQSKTEAGKRIIPIHSKLRPIVEKWMKKETRCEYLFYSKFGTKYEYDNYRLRNWMPYFKNSPIPHRAHDTRHTFKTYCEYCGLHCDAVEKMIGHTLKLGITSLYNNPTVAMLSEQMEYLTYSDKRRKKIVYLEG